MTDEELNKQKQWAMNRAFAILEEHFDTVVVLAATQIPEKRTMNLTKNSGDVYAAIGLSVTFAKRKIDYLNSIGDDDA